MTKGIFCRAKFTGISLCTLAIGAVSLQAATNVDWGSYSWSQENCPNLGSQLTSGTLGGATFNVTSSDTTGSIVDFPASVSGGTFDANVGILSVLVGDATSPDKRAVNLPFGGNVGQVVFRRGLSVGWAGGTVGGAGAALTVPTLPNQPGPDFVIFESGSAGVPEAMMVRVQVANQPGGPFFTDWHYFAPATQDTAPATGVLHAYEYDLSDFGLDATAQIDRIEIANMVARDRIGAVGTWNGAGSPPPPPSYTPFRPGMGQFGGAAELRGNTERDFGWFQSSLFDVGEKGTLNLWVKMDDTSRRNQLFEGPEDGGFEFQYRSNSGGQFFSRANDGGDYVIPSGGAATTSWTNLQFTWDASISEMRIYIDGTEVTYLAGFDQNLSGWDLLSATDTVNGFMNLGRDPGDASRYFDGMMDDIGWFDDVLNNTDRDAIRNSGVAALGGDARLVAHWDLDSSSGTTETDNKNGILLTFESAEEIPWVAEGVVLPEVGGTYSMANPGPDPGSYASFDIPYGNSTFDPDPLYLAALNDLEEINPIPPGPATLEITFDDACYQPGDTVTATVSMKDLGADAAGFQAFLDYDDSVLTFTGWSYTAVPFGLPVLDTLATVNPNPGELNLASGIDQLNGQVPSSADAALVELTFTVSGPDDCAAADLLTFRNHAPPTRLTDLQGQELLPLTLTDAPAIEIDGTPPSLTCPADLTVNTDPGVCEASVTVTPPSPTDNCGVESLTFERSDNAALTLSDPFPLGVTTITWTATDCAGNVSVCVQTVTVEDNEAPIVTAGSIDSCYSDVATAESAAIAATTATDNCTATIDLVITAATTGTCDAEITVTVTDESGNSDTAIYNTRIDNAPPVITCPPDVSVQCLAEADPGLLLGSTSGGVAIYYNDNGGGETPTNQAYLKAQFSDTSTAGAPFLFDNTPLTGNGLVNWQGIYSGLTSPDSQFGLDLVLEAPSSDGSVPTPILNAYDNGNNAVSGRILVGPVTWAINDYKPHTPDITAGDVLNSIIRSQSPGVGGTDVVILRNDVSVSGTVYTAHIAGKLVSDGINHWYGLTTPDSPMANLGLNGDFFFEGILTYDAASDPYPLMDFYAGAITLTANFPSSAVGFATATDNCTLFPVVTYVDADNGGSGCNGDPKIITRTWTATDECGLQSSCVQTITVEDNTPPTFLSVPADITADADVGSCDLTLTTSEIGAPTAADNCDLDVDITWVRSDGATNLDDPFDSADSPITITWTATDDCGNTSDHVQTVTVDAVNDMAVTLTLAAVTQSPLQRCITFELWDCGAAVPTPTIVKKELVFTTGVGGVTASTTIPIPCGAYTCVTARDALHTLRRTLDAPDFGIVGSQYVADFDAAGKPLIGGNLNDDIYVDILDFGLFAGQFGTTYGFTDTTCLTAAPHADISGNGTVFTEDFTFIQINFLDQSELNCCAPTPSPLPMAQAVLREDANGDGGVTVADLTYVKARLGLDPAGAATSADVNGDGGITIRDLSAVKAAIGKTATTQEGPLERISTAELTLRGLDHLIGADLNNDGWLDELDIAAFLGGQQP